MDVEAVQPKKDKKKKGSKTKKKKKLKNIESDQSSDPTAAGDSSRDAAGTGFMFDSNDDDDRPEFDNPLARSSPTFEDEGVTTYGRPVSPTMTVDAETDDV